MQYRINKHSKYKKKIAVYRKKDNCEKEGDMHREWGKERDRDTEGDIKRYSIVNRIHNSDGRQKITLLTWR